MDTPESDVIARDWQQFHQAPDLHVGWHLLEQYGLSQIAESNRLGAARVGLRRALAWDPEGLEVNNCASIAKFNKAIIFTAISPRPLFVEKVAAIGACFVMRSVLMSVDAKRIAVIKKMVGDDTWANLMEATRSRPKLVLATRIPEEHISLANLVTTIYALGSTVFGLSCAKTAPWLRRRVALKLDGLGKSTIAVTPVDAAATLSWVAPELALITAN